MDLQTNRRLLAEYADEMNRRDKAAARHYIAASAILRAAGKLKHARQSLAAAGVCRRRAALYTRRTAFRAALFANIEAGK